MFAGAGLQPVTIISISSKALPSKVLCSSKPLAFIVSLSRSHSSKALPSQAVCSSQALPVINPMKHLG